MKAQKEARKAIHRRIKRLSKDADAETLQKLAESYAKVEYGAQGHTIYDERIHREAPLERDTGFAR